MFAKGVRLGALEKTRRCSFSINGCSENDVATLVLKPTTIEERLLRSVDGRIRDLLEQADALKGSNNADFQSWRARAQGAISEKLGQGSDLAGQMKSLRSI